MKPILFNTEMVRAILDGRKSCTRRAVKDKDIINGWDCEADGTPIAYIDQATGDSYPPTAPCPYHPGDILWVRETWQLNPTGFNEMPPENWWVYKASNVLPDTCTKWRSPILMPREAARLFLRVTDVRVERLQEIDGRGVLAEGVDNGKSNPKMGTRWENMQRIAFESLWGTTVKPADRPRYGWSANPYVWVIEFTRISREEAESK